MEHDVRERIQIHFYKINVNHSKIKLLLGQTSDQHQNK